MSLNWNAIGLIISLLALLIGIVGIFITMYTYINKRENVLNRYPFIKKYFENKPSDAMLFSINLGKSSKCYWKKKEQLPSFSAIPLFDEHCSSYFEIDDEKFVDNVDPSFDIRVCNKTSSSVLVNELGIQIESVTHIATGYGEAQAAEIQIQASYIAKIPNLKARLYKNFKQSGGILNPTKIDLQVPVEMQNPFKLDIDGILRYEILLDKYVKHMPNLAVIYFWVEVQESEYNSKQKKHFYSKKRYNSEPIYIFTY